MQKCNGKSLPAWTFHLTNNKYRRTKASLCGFSWVSRKNYQAGSTFMRHNVCAIVPDKNHIHNFMASIEQLKNGRAYDDRYRFQSAVFDAPHVWIFTNTVPPTELLTRNRWKIWGINHQLELVPWELLHHHIELHPIPEVKLTLNIVR